MNIVRMAAAGIAVAACLAPATLINVGYSASKGDGLLMIALGLGAGLSTIIAAASLSTLVNRHPNPRPGVTVIASLCLMITMSWNLATAVGAASSVRDLSASERLRVSDDRSFALNRRHELSNERVALMAATKASTPAMIEAELDAMKQDRRWTTTRACTDATRPDSRSFCADFSAAQSRLAASQRVMQLDNEIAALDAKLANEKTAVGDADPQTASLSRLAEVFGVRVEEQHVAAGMALAFAVVLEAIAIGGPALAAFVFLVPPAQAHLRQPEEQVSPDISTAVEPMELSSAKTRPKRQRAGKASNPALSAKAFCAEALTKRAGASVSAAEMLSAHIRWCASRGLPAANQTLLGRALKEAGLKKASVRGRTVYRGLSILHAVSAVPKAV